MTRIQSLRRTSLFLSQAFLLAGGLGCARNRTPDAPPEPFHHTDGGLVVPEGSPLRQSLQVVALREQSLQGALAVPAVIEADPSGLVKVLPPVSGRIVQIHVYLGDWVKKGQPLATLDSADLAQAYADFQRAKAAFQQARRTLDRVRELGEHEVASRREVEQAETDYVGAEGEWRRAEAKVQQLGASPDETRSTRILVLRSPIDGQVSDLTVAAGGYWNDVNASFMTLANVSKVWLTASVQEKDIPAVTVGQEVTATLPSYPGEAFHSRVATRGEILDPDTRTVKVRMAFDNAGHRLLPGMFASVTFQGKAHAALAVPTTAVVQGTEGPRVFVEKSAWVFEARPVRIGAQIGGLTEILGGVQAGERVVTKNAVVLND